MAQHLSPLHAAVETDDTPRVQALVAAGADIEERQRVNIDNNCTPLYRAAEKGYTSVARLLVERGANKEATDSAYGRTSLSAAAEKGHINMVRMLIEHGANKEAANHIGLTALMWASIRGHVAVVEDLLEQGCDMDHAVSNNGYTALHWAAHQDQLEVAQLLLRFGAKIDLRNNNGQTAADLATQRGHQRIADAIRAEEIRRRDHGFKRDRSTIEGTEEHAASKRPRAEREAEEAAALAAADDESDDDDDDGDDEDDDDEEEEG
jgi:uncharacterized protein